MDEISELIRERLDRPRADRMFLYEGTWIERGWARDFVDKLETMLDGLGLASGVPIGFAPLSRPDFISAMLALIAGKRPITMIYAYQSSEAMARKLEELKLPVVIVDDAQWDGSMLDAAERLGTAAIGVSMKAPYVRLRAPYSPRPSIELRGRPEQPGIELLSSGTTGPPKLCPLSYESILSRLVLGTMMNEGLRKEVMLYFPLGNISGVYILIPTIAADAPMIVIDKFRVPEWVDFIKRVQPETINLPPAGFRMILEAEVDPADLSSLRYITTGAATLDPSVRKEFEERYGVAILQAYGATEFGGVVATMTPAHIEEFGRTKSDSVGRPLADNTWRVVDPETGAERPPGQDGRLEVLAPAISGQWHTTTDLCMIDEDGFLWHRGRLDGAIMRGGFKIIPEQVAQSLMEHSAVANAAVVGVDHPRLGQVPVAAVELRHDQTADAADLEKHLRARLPATNLPVEYRFVDVLPRTLSLKVDIAAVKRMFAKT